MASPGQSVLSLSSMLKDAYKAARNASAIAEEAKDMLSRLGGTTFTDQYFDGTPTVDYTKDEFNNAMGNLAQLELGGTVSTAVESTYTAVTGPVKAIE